MLASDLPPGWVTAVRSGPAEESAFMGCSSQPGGQTLVISRESSAYHFESTGLVSYAELLASAANVDVRRLRSKGVIACYTQIARDGLAIMTSRSINRVIDVQFRSMPVPSGYPPRGRLNTQGRAKVANGMGELLRIILT